MTVWPDKDEWQQLTPEQKLIWAVRVLQKEMRELEPLPDSAREAIILGDFAIEDA